MKFFPIALLEEFTTRIFVSKHVPEKNARYIAKMATATEAMGITTHGLVAMTGYLDQEIPESLDPQSEPVVVSETGAAALIDGKMGFGQLAFRKAAELAIEKAGTTGVAMIAIKDTHWLGALGPYLEPIARSGFMAQLWGQSSQCADCAPVGGMIAKFSTNPVALAFPTDSDPVIADISTATVSMGAVGRMARNNKKARAKIFMDKEGCATDDPNVVKDDGSIFFLGGPEYAHKGYGLSLWAEALTALAGGSCNNPELDQSQNLNLTVMDPDVFNGKEYFRKEIGRFIAHMKNNKLRPGYDEIRLPGARALASYALAVKQGVPLESEGIDTLNKIAEKNGVEALA